MDFQSGKSFGKLKLWAFQPYHQILCILMHVGDVGDISSTPIGCNAMYVGDVGDRKNLEKPSVSAFQNFFRIENPLNIKEVMGKNVLVIQIKGNTVLFHVEEVENTLYKCTMLNGMHVGEVEDGPSNYTVYHNSNYLNKEIHRIIASNNSLLRIKT